MNFIELSLKRIDDKRESICSLDEAIEENKVIVILGPPGSGKSSILKKYQQEHPENTRLVSIKRFINLGIDADSHVLMLDGLDEYRSVTDDKTFVLHELGYRISQLIEKNSTLKVVISCREMDWYGEHDKNALKDEIGQDAALFYILPLSDVQKEELAKNLQIDDREVFLEKFSDRGLLDNPQMFYMLSEIWQSDRSAIDSKKMLYEKFIEHSREKNLEHVKSGIRIERNEMFKITGYLAFYYMFAGIDKFDESLIDQIVDEENGYTREKIEAVLKTKLFAQSSFIHRTVAEYVLAKYIIEYKMHGKLVIDRERVKKLFVKNGKIPTELRGTYAWLCSLGAGDDFIAIDPYYQAIHGDNSLFNYEDKKKIIEAVKEYSLVNPYFFEFGQKMELEGFYTKELDDLLIDEYNEAFKLKNHYAYFIVNIIVQGADISEKIKLFVRACIEDNAIPSYFKKDFLPLFQDECEYLKGILNKIKENTIEDPKDLLKEEILKRIYLRCISHTEVAYYLIEYQSEVLGYCNYLYNTPYEYKFELIDSIYKLSYKENGEPCLHLPENVKNFISDYFLETVLMYGEKFTAIEIFKIIKHFKKYYKWYEVLKFRSYRYAVQDKLKMADEKLQRLANELYHIYIHELVLTDNEHYDVHNFHYFYSLKTPTNQSDVLFNALSDKLDRDTNLNLFLNGINFLPRDENNIPVLTDQAKKFAAQFGFEAELYKRMNPEKSEWEKESEKQEAERLKEELEIRKKNEAYFENRSDEEIKRSFGDLHWISNLLYIKDDDQAEKYLESKTFLRLRNILKQVIYTELISPELLTIESLAETAPKANRNIDIVYYVSLALNAGTDIKIENNVFKEYLYINALQHSRTSNIIENDYVSRNEESNLSETIELLKKYIFILLEKQFPELSYISNKYIATYDDLKSLKNIAMACGSNLVDIKNDIFQNLLSAIWNELPEEELWSLSHIEDLNDNNRLKIDALLVLRKNKRDKFSINMAIALRDLINDPFSERPYERFQSLDSHEKVKLISYMMSAFDTEESIEPVNGFQSPKNICADFLRNFSFSLLNIDELKELYKDHEENEDIWKNRILNKISEITQLESDQLYTSYGVDKIKFFLIKNEILSKDDFFTEVFLQLERLKQIIEDNRDNDKLSFYNDLKPKVENSCRDVVLQRLKDMHGNIFDFNKEHPEAENRVDINIRYKKNLSYEVQIECKRDDNSGLSTGIQEQLINKYFSSGVQYGIYLIFYFGQKKNKNKELMMEKIYDSIPNGYENKIKIVCIDLRLSN